VRDVLRQHHRLQVLPRRPSPHRRPTTSAPIPAGGPCLSKHSRALLHLSQYAGVRFPSWPPRSPTTPTSTSTRSHASTPNLTAASPELTRRTRPDIQGRHQTNSAAPWHPEAPSIDRARHRRHRPRPHRRPRHAGPHHEPRTCTNGRRGRVQRCLPQPGIDQLREPLTHQVGPLLGRARRPPGSDRQPIEPV
jgi:hypothetical protein